MKKSELKALIRECINESLNFKPFAVAPNWNSMGSHSFFELKNGYYVNSKDNIDRYNAKDFVENKDVSFFDDENKALDYLDYLNNY